MRFGSDDHHLRSSTGNVILQRTGAWEGFRAELVRRRSLARQDFRVGGDKHAIFLNLEGTARFGENFLDGKRADFVARPEGSIAYVPPHRIWTGWDDGDETAAYLFLAVDREHASRFFRDARRAHDLKPEFGFHDLAIQLAARKIAAELPRIDHASGMIVEGYLTTIFGHLSRRANIVERQVKGGLAPIVLKRVLDRLGDIQEDKLTISGLCHDIGISPSHFIRAFKQSTGMTPHAYLNGRRIERACTLLRGTDLPITEIALMCGFANASHFSTAFAQALSDKPTIYRSMWRQQSGK